jgi:peptide/nickel transport system permease protein
VLWNDGRARFGLLVITFYVLMGTLGVVLVDVPEVNDGGRYVQPFTTVEFPLGTDGLGRGLMGMIIHATPGMLKMILAGAVFSISVATIVGTVAGYKGGTLERVLMSLTDIMMTLPGLPLIIIIAAILQPKSPWLVGIVLTINAWAGLARALRSEVLSLRDEAYVEASRTMGIDTHDIIFKDLIPNLMPYIMINFVGAARGVIFASVGLYFLGILPFNALNWGVILNMAYKSGGALYTWKAAHWLLVPTFTIILLSYGLVMFSQGLDRVFNPRVRAKHAKTIESEDSEPTASGESTVDSRI